MQVQETDSKIKDAVPTARIQERHLDAKKLAAEKIKTASLKATVDNQQSRITSLIHRAITAENKA